MAEVSDSAANAQVSPLMGKSHKMTLGLVFAAAIIAAFAFIAFYSPKEPSYAGKPVSFWCDQLPFTHQLPPALGGGFSRGWRSSTNQTEQNRLREMEEQALTAIDTLGTNCLPTLLSRLKKRRSPLQFESRKLAANLGFIKRTEVGIWHMRRMEALTGIVELGYRSSAATQELEILKSDPDPWLTAAASYALQQVGPKKIRFIP
jgi:hypothetical protein